MGSLNLLLDTEDKLYKQVSSRVKNLPAGSLQRIVLDLGGKKIWFELCRKDYQISTILY